MFQIHEDRTNLTNDESSQNHETKETKIMTQNKLAVESQHLDNRKVLGHITNTRFNDRPSYCRVKKEPWNLKQLQEVFEVVETFDDKKKNEDDIILNHACSFVPYRLDNIESPKSPEGSLSPQDVSMVNVDSSIDEDANEPKARDDMYAELEYRKYICCHLLKTETRHRPHPHYMNKQPELTDGMRSILVDWLVSISDEYQFAGETLHLAVSYIDRFLSKMSVVRSKLQLLGITSMMIAAKYEEVHPPDIAEYSSLTKDTCTIQQILKMEQVILRTLSFDLTTPTVNSFIGEFSIQGNLSTTCVDIAMFISELCLVESVYFLSYLPSEIAASSIALSRHTISATELWPNNLETACGYSLTELYPIIKKQHLIFEESPNKMLLAVRQKYNKNWISYWRPRKLS